MDGPRIHVAHRLLRARDWQDRPQLERVRDWWRTSRRGGVCALVGIGGAGKTAVADRFLRSLPGVLPATDVPEDSTLRPPGPAIPEARGGKLHNRCADDRATGTPPVHPGMNVRVAAASLGERRPTLPGPSAA